MKCRCNECEAERQREIRKTLGWKQWKKDYRRSKLGRDSEKRYKMSEKGRAAERRYKSGLAGRLAIKRWSSSDRSYHNQMRKNYGLTPTEYQVMFVKQHGCCAICGFSAEDQRSHGKRKKRLEVDHCHKTRNVRGLLCGKCNTALGMFRDDPRLLLEAILYLTSGGIPQR